MRSQKPERAAAASRCHGIGHPTECPAIPPRARMVIVWQRQVEGASRVRTTATSPPVSSGSGCPKMGQGGHHAAGRRCYSRAARGLARAPEAGEGGAVVWSEIRGTGRGRGTTPMSTARGVWGRTGQGWIGGRFGGRPDGGAARRRTAPEGDDRSEGTTVASASGVTEREEVRRRKGNRYQEPAYRRLQRPRR